MKKFGFTLAEVLITLGIIGVVAALTAPALVQNAGTAKVGPTLAKVVSTLELANESILKDEEATDLSKITEKSTNDYLEKLSTYISGSSYETDTFDGSNISPAFNYYNDSSTSSMGWRNFKEFHFADNITILIWVYGNNQNVTNTYTKKGSFKGGFATIYLDINGIKVKPNTVGKDIFLLFIDKSGQVIPAGSNTYAWLQNDENRKYTSTKGDYGCNENYVGKGTGCAGSIFENNLKVIYQ